MHHTYFLNRRTLSVQLLYCVFERNVLALERAAYIRSGFRPLVCAIYFVNCYPSRPAEHSCSDGTKMSTETEKALYTIELTLHEICDHCSAGLSRKCSIFRAVGTFVVRARKCLARNRPSLCCVQSLRRAHFNVPWCTATLYDVLQVVCHSVYTSVFGK
jgi:hypothetical protein